MSGLVLIFFQPQANIDIPNFDRWRGAAFDRIPGIQTKSVLTCADSVEGSKVYRYMNLYHVSNLCLVTDNLIQGLVSSPSATEHVSHQCWQLYSLLTTLRRPNLPATSTPSTLVTVGMTIADEPGALEDFHSWYNKEHMLGMATVPGWCEGSRYALDRSIGDTLEYASPFLAVHKWERENGLGGDVWKKVTFTPWSERVVKLNVAPIHRRIWELQAN